MQAGHDLRKIIGGQEEIVLSLHPTLEGRDTASSVAHMAEAQQRGMTSLCKRGATASMPTPATTPPGAIRLHVVCEEPRLVTTFVAFAQGGNVFSYEHLWYEA
jgi:hypothetical protein